VKKEGRALRKTAWLLVVLAGVCGAVTLLEDDFSDGTADGWTEYSTAPDSADYYVEDGWYNMEITPANAFAFAFSGDEEGVSSWHMSVPDYTLFCRAKAYENTQHVGFAVRWQEPYSDEKAYVLWLRYFSNMITIYRHDSPSSFQELASSPFTLDPGESYWVRLEVYGTLIRGKVWQGDLSEEPDSFLVSVYDDTYIEPGSIGLGCQGYDSMLKHAAFDHVIVTDSAYDLAPFTWGSIKGSF
jgi:hypothetical protein